MYRYHLTAVLREIILGPLIIAYYPIVLFLVIPDAREELLGIGMFSPLNGVFLPLYILSLIALILPKDEIHIFTGLGYGLLVLPIICLAPLVLPIGILALLSTAGGFSGFFELWWGPIMVFGPGTILTYSLFN